MKCKIICDLLPMYIDEVCSDETKEVVEEHLNTCSECRREYEQMKAEISLNEAEDLDEKELMKKGKETMMEYVKDKVYRKWILGDTILNLLLSVYLFAYGMKGMIEEGGVTFEGINIGGTYCGILFAVNLIYWVQYLRKGDLGISNSVDAICKWSLGLKFVFVICAVTVAVAIGFYVMFSGGSV